MEDIIALVVFALIAIIAISLSVKKKIETKLTIILLCFAIFSGIGIANYDLIKKIKWGDLEIETARNQINELKQDALDEIGKEIENQKESIKLLTANANDTREKIEKQRESLEIIINTASELEYKINGQKDEIIKISNEAINTKNDIKTLNQASAQIALILVRATYFSLETKNEFGTERAQKAIEEILADLNKVLPMVIPNPSERKQWIKNLESTLPPRNK